MPTAPSSLKLSHASVIQGSALGLASYIVTAADLHPIHEQNRIFKFADDTYLIVPAVNTNTSCQEEIQHLQTWAADNNLNLNRCAHSAQYSTLLMTTFFHRVKTDSNHVLQPYLPQKIGIPYQLRTRSHNISQ